MNLVWLKLIKRILTHKYYVAKYCFQIGLYWQGITHDLSKFSVTEFSGAIKCWDDNIRSLANECNISQATYSNYEVGLYLPSSLVLYTICYNHGLSMDEIVK